MENILKYVCTVHGHINELHVSQDLYKIFYVRNAILN